MATICSDLHVFNSKSTIVHHIEQCYFVKIINDLNLDYVYRLCHNTESIYLSLLNLQLDLKCTKWCRTSLDIPHRLIYCV